MCMTTKIEKTPAPEVIKTAVKADASVQKSNASNRNLRGLVSENIRTSNNGLEDEILSSKKKLLGE